MRKKGYRAATPTSNTSPGCTMQWTASQNSCHHLRLNLETDLMRTVRVNPVTETMSWKTLNSFVAETDDNQFCLFATLHINHWSVVDIECFFYGSFNVLHVFFKSLQTVQMMDGIKRNTSQSWYYLTLHDITWTFHSWSKLLQSMMGKKRQFALLRI